ncbi:MAG: hexokinase [Treponema sp.]|nr:hexokinase [Treponema sp.]
MKIDFHVYGLAEIAHYGHNKSMNKPYDPSALSEFARYYGFHYDRIDPVALVKDVLFEMERGLRGPGSCLPMIPAYISPVSRTTPGKTVIALDAGGTNLRAALVKFDENGKAVVGESRKAPMPGTAGPLKADAFFDAIAEVVVPLLEMARDKVEGIGFCFSYPMEITKEADGILLAFSKEVDAPEVIGKAIGAGLKAALLRRNVKAPERIVLLNDTVATLLSGLSELPLSAAHKGDNPMAEPMVGFILGTGFNTAYPEKNIPKIGFHAPKNPQIVVCETGNFAHRYSGFLDREYDKTTKNPGAYTLEKATSGAYLGPLTLHIFKQAVRDGLISFSKKDAFLALPTLQTKDLNLFLHEPLAQRGPIGELLGKDDLDALASFVFIASLVTERGALLSAAMVAAAAEKACAGNDVSRGLDSFTPVRIAVEGTTFMIYKGMRSALESYLHIMLNRDRPRPFTIAPVEQASLLGAAVAALSK